MCLSKNAIRDPNLVIKQIEEALKSRFPDEVIKVNFAWIDEWRLVILRAYPLHVTPPKIGYGRLASIGGSLDYHTVLYQLLEFAVSELERDWGHQPRCFFVDKDGGDDRQWAVACGSGFYGKHHLVISPGMGSALNIGTAKIRLPNAVGEGWRKPEVAGFSTTCGTCRKCIEACPTEALTEGQPLNTQRCRSALNQRKGPLSDIESLAIEDWLYGCDVCQWACPYNHGVLKHEPLHLTLKAFEGLTNRTFKETYGGRAFAYLGLTRLKRNVASIRHWQERNL